MGKRGLLGPELQVGHDSCGLITQDDVDLDVLGTGNGCLEGSGVGLPADLGGGVDQLVVVGAVVGVDQVCLRHKQIILTFLRLHPSTAFLTLWLAMRATPFLLRDSCPQ